MDENNIISNQSEDEEIPNSDFEFHENGLIKLERLKVTEKLIKHVHYDLKGQITKIIDYDDLGNLLNSIELTTETAKNGLSFTYYPNGNVQSLKYFINGKINFVEKIYDTDGQLLEVITYNKGIKNGPHTIFSKRNAKLSEVVYSANKPSGKAKYFYETGELKAEVSFNSGMKEGTAKYFHKNGNLRRKENMKAGMRDGEISYYYENGAIKEKRFYEQGIINKATFKYTMDGELISTKYYENGKEVDKIPEELVEETADIAKIRPSAPYSRTGTYSRPAPAPKQVEKKEIPIKEYSKSEVIEKNLPKTEPKIMSQSEQRRMKFKIAVNYSIIFAVSLILIYIIYNLIIYFL